MTHTFTKTLAIIGGSGLNALAELTITHVETGIITPYGAPSGPLTHGRINDRPVIFLARHGVGHILPPHRVNYRANLWALKAAGAQHILAINAVGGIHADFGPGRIAIPDQIIDYTSGREHTYFDGASITPTPIAQENTEKIQVTHVDFTYPYCTALRAQLRAAAASAQVDVHFGGTYGATQGPRLESKAEIDRLERDGCHMVGMTGMPEAALARELGLCYACCAVVANWGAGRSAELIAMEQIQLVLNSAMNDVRALLKPLLWGL